MNVSLVYNNDKLIGKCSKYAIEKVQGTSPFVILENFEPKQPQLNENQQVVLDWLKNRYTGNVDPFGVAACLFSQTPRSEVIVATLKLTRDEQAQVLKIFANWTLEQVEDL